MLLSLLEGSIPPEDSEFIQPPPVMEEDEEVGEAVYPFSEEGSHSIDDILDNDPAKDRV